MMPNCVLFTRDRQAIILSSSVGQANSFACRLAFSRDVRVLEVKAALQDGVSKRSQDSLDDMSHMLLPKNLLLRAPQRLPSSRVPTGHTESPKPRAPLTSFFVPLTSPREVERSPLREAIKSE